MMITTKWFGPTNTKGSRFKATLNSDGMSVTVPRDYSKDSLGAAMVAVSALLEKISRETGEPSKPRQFTYTSTNDGFIFMPVDGPTVTLP